MAGAGGELASDGEFSLGDWAEVRDGKCLSQTWSIHAGGANLVEFDTVKKTLYINREELAKAGITIQE